MDQTETIAIQSGRLLLAIYRNLELKLFHIGSTLQAQRLPLSFI